MRLPDAGGPGRRGCARGRSLVPEAAARVGARLNARTRLPAALVRRLDDRRNGAESTGDADNRVSDRAQRRALRDAYRQAPPDAGVYLIHNSAAGKALLGSTVNLASLHLSLIHISEPTRLGMI